MAADRTAQAFQTTTECHATTEGFYGQRDSDAGGLRESRTPLIPAAVTGKIDVRREV